MGYVYAVEADNAMVKIGVSKNPGRRISEVCKKADCHPLRKYVSKNISNYSELESAALSKFKNENSTGEWVDCNFDVVSGFIEEKVNKIGVNGKERRKIRVTLDAETWEQFRGLAKFLKKDVDQLLDEAMKQRIESEKTKGK